MDYSKLPKLSIAALALAAALGVIAAIIVYQAQIRGLIPVISGSPAKPESLKIQTVIQEENAVTSVVESALPSIVTISLSGVKNENAGGGVGFVVDKKGLIVTNKHSVSEPGQYVVMTNDGQKFEVKNVYKDPNLDLSLLLIDASNLKALDLGDSSKLKLGQTVIAMGQSKQSVNVSVGVVAGLNNLIQTDALINSDNSGGPLLSSAGQVVGVNLVVSGSQNFGLAIPVNALEQLIASISQGPTKPILGLTYKFISKDLVALNGNPPPGASIQAVSDGGPADKAGIKVGDIITKINGQAVDTENVISDTVSKGKIGQQLELTILRNGQELTAKAVLSAVPNQ